VGVPARLLTETGDRHPHQIRRPHGVVVNVGRLDLKVRSGRLAVEPDREIVRRKDLTEGHRGWIVVIGHHVSVVDGEFAERSANITPERVVAHAGDNRGPAAQAGSGDGDVGGGAAEILAERHDVLQPDADLQRIDVHSATPEGEHLEPPRGYVASTGRGAGHSSPSPKRLIEVPRLRGTHQPHICKDIRSNLLGWLLIPQPHKESEPPRHMGRHEHER
jgi:hypothetical protein